MRTRHIGRQARIGIDPECDVLGIALVIIDIAVDIAGLAQVLQCKGGGLLILRQQFPDFLLAASPAVAEFTLVHTGFHGKGHIVSLLDRIFHIPAVGPGRPGLQADIRGNVKIDMLPVAIVIAHVTRHTTVLFHAGNGNGCRAVIRRQKGGIQILAVPLVMKIAYIDAGFHGQRDVFALFDCDLRVCIGCSRGTGPQAAIRADLKCDGFRVSVVVIHSAVNVCVLFDIVDGKGQDILGQSLGTAIYISVPTAVQFACIHAGFYGQRDAFADQHGNKFILPAGGCRAGPKPGIDNQFELHRLVVSIVVVNIAVDPHALIHVFKREGIALNIGKRCVRIVCPVPFIPKPAQIDAGFHGQRDASAHRHGNSLTIRTGPCGTGPQAGIGRNDIIKPFGVSLHISDRALDSVVLVHHIDGEDIGALPRQERGVHSIAAPIITQFTGAHPGLHAQGNASVQGNCGFRIVLSGVRPIGVETQRLGIPPDGVEARIICQHQGISGLIRNRAVILQGPAQKIVIVPNSFGQRDLRSLLRGDGIEILAAVCRECDGTHLPLRQGSGEQSRQQHQAEQQGQGLFPSVFHSRPPCCFYCMRGSGSGKQCFRFLYEKAL